MNVVCFLVYVGFNVVSFGVFVGWKKIALWVTRPEKLSIYRSIVGPRNVQAELTTVVVKVEKMQSSASSASSGSTAGRHTGWKMLVFSWCFSSS